MKAAGPSGAAFCIDTHYAYHVRVICARDHCMSSHVEEGEMAKAVCLAIDALHLRWQDLQKIPDT